MDIYLTTLAQIVEILLCIIILVRTEPALNRMGAQATPITIRISFALLATGAVAGILAIFAGKVPDVYVLILTAGTAAITICERRIRLLTRIRTHRKGHSNA